MANLAKAAHLLCMTAVLTAPLLCAGASFKVASLDLSFSGQTANAETATRASRLSQAAKDLKALHPDVILLQGARDWRMCNDLAQMLKPADYHVVVCSSFRDLYVAAPAPAQAAILARHKGYFSWSAAWKGSEDALLPGGYAFAALNVGGQKVGCFSTLTEAPVPREFKSKTDPNLVHAGAVGQILEQLREVQGWVLNRPGVFMVGGSLDPELSKPSPTDTESFPLLTEAGFAQAPVHPRARPACFFYAPGEAITIRTVDTGADLLAYEVVVEGAKLASGAASKTVGAQAAKTTPVQPSQERGKKPSPQLQRAKEGETVEQARKVPNKSSSAAVQFANGEPVTAKPATKEVVENGAAASAKPPYLNILEAGPSPDMHKQAQATATSDQPPSTRAWEQLRFSPWLAAGVGFGGVMLLAIPLIVWVKRRKGARRRLLVARTEGGGLLTNLNYVVMTAEDQRGLVEPGTVLALEPEQGPPTHTWQQNVVSERPGEDSQAGVLSQEVREWMKQRLFQKLFQDRKHLLETQEEAAIRTAQVTERLARIEEQIQQQNRAYQLRIDELTRELHVAREESRELLRARIAQVKAEMESAQARLLASAERDPED